jgi:hypothetical protein
MEENQSQPEDLPRATGGGQIILPELTRSRQASGGLCYDRGRPKIPVVVCTRLPHRGCERL